MSVFLAIMTYNILSRNISLIYITYIRYIMLYLLKIYLCLYSSN